MMLDKIFNQLNNQTNSNGDSHSLNHYDIPHITNANDLNEWEDTIKDSSYLSKIAQQLSLMGGHSISETVRKLMQRLFSDTFLVDYSFIGFKGKKTFSNLRSCDLIKLAVRKVPLFQNASDNEIEKPLKSFMAQASARLKFKTKVIPSTNSENTDSEKDL
ncbi:unnamed protein product [Macrosiphum euphorbiae]|uniref:DUF4806 domain-containing protein n=1 Tax=Macrosiphum euphorbiae TaxID=13131 RepID=A0AAV0Y9Q2_9HEMI|nr:unnamed protein product [Macrosiphum euphorbiae]